MGVLQKLDGLEAHNKVAYIQLNALPSYGKQSSTIRSNFAQSPSLLPQNKS